MLGGSVTYQSQEIPEDGEHAENSQVYPAPTGEGRSFCIPVQIAHGSHIEYMCHLVDVYPLRRTMGLQGHTLLGQEYAATKGEED